jgi:single-stranded-DNA-specific exonuclease
MKSQALKTLNEIHLAEESMPHGICLFDPQWHQGVIGILASRIKDKMHRPVIAFAPADNGEIKGSARSVEGIHIRDVLDEIATANPDLLTKFGGHAMAAGLSLQQENFERFAHLFAEKIDQQFAEKNPENVIYSDGQLNSPEINLLTAEAIRSHGPWGQGFPEPIFDGEFEVMNHRVLKDVHLKLELAHPGSNKSFDAIAFNAIDLNSKELPAEAGKKVHLAYKLDVNEFRGRRNVQLMIEHII